MVATLEQGTTTSAASIDAVAAHTRWVFGSGAGLVIVLVWLVVLPWLGRQRAIRAHVDALHAADINASAMFYSELDCRYMLAR